MKTQIMGILNVTPDSFSDGGLYVDVNKAVQHAKQMVQDGADIIDVGGESSRPGSDPVSEEEELRRVLPVITRLVKEVDAPISIDTYKPKVAEECLKLGVKIVNDISGFRNQEMIKVAAKYNAKVIIMHMLGEPKTMQADPKYDNVIEDIKTFFKKRIKAVTEAGIKDVVLDPGIGFGKTLEHNLTILKNLEQFEELGYPLLVGASRKTFLGMITGLPVEERLESSLAAHVIAVMNGCSIIRTHDVKETRRAMMVVEAIRKT